MNWAYGNSLIVAHFIENWKVWGSDVSEPMLARALLEPARNLMARSLLELEMARKFLARTRLGSKIFGSKWLEPCKRAKK